MTSKTLTCWIGSLKYSPILSGQGKTSAPNIELQEGLRVRWAGSWDRQNNKWTLLPLGLGCNRFCQHKCWSVCVCVFGLGWEVGGMGVLEGRYKYRAFSSFISVSDGFVWCWCSVFICSVFMFNRRTSRSSPKLADGVRSVSSCHRLLLSFLVFLTISSVQFSHSVVSDFLRPHESQHSRPPCPSPTPGVHSNSCPSSWWCHPAISSSVVPFFSFPLSLPASESFPMSQLLARGRQSIGVSALASVLPKNAQDWSPLEWNGWISLQ